MQKIVENRDLSDSEKISQILDVGQRVVSGSTLRFVLSKVDTVDKKTRIKIAEFVAIQEIYDLCACDDVLHYAHRLFEDESLTYKYLGLKMCRVLFKTEYKIDEQTGVDAHLSKLCWFIVNLPHAQQVGGEAVQNGNVTNQLTLEESNSAFKLKNRLFGEEELKLSEESSWLAERDDKFAKAFKCKKKVDNLLFMCSSLALEYLCDFLVKWGVGLQVFSDTLVKVTAQYFTSDLKHMESCECLIDFCVSAVAFLSLAKAPASSSFINLSFVKLDASDYRNKKKLLYILKHTSTPLTKTILTNEDLLNSLMNLFHEDELKAMLLDVMLMSKIPEAVLDKKLVSIYSNLDSDNTGVELLDKLAEGHIYLLNFTPSYVRIQYSMNMCIKLIDYAHNSRKCTKSIGIYKLIQTIIGFVIHTKMLIGPEEKSILVEFMLAPIKLNNPVKDFYVIFTHLKSVDQQFIIKSVSEIVLLKYIERMETWADLLDVDMYSMIFCLTANRLLLNDLCFCHYNHMRMFPLTYRFFSTDKKYYTSMFQHFFPKIINLLLHYRNSDLVDCEDALMSQRLIYGYLEKMFLSITTNSYTGYYVVFNNFNTFVDEMYSLYTLTNDMFYLKTLFNIPISLGLLVSKCALIRKPMEQGIRLACSDFVLTYLDYLIEFDAEGEYVDLLDNVLILMKHTGDPKILNICNKFTTIHRINYNARRYGPQGDAYTNDVLIGLDYNLIVRNENNEIELNFIKQAKTNVSDSTLEELFKESSNLSDRATRRITKENIIYKLVANERDALLKRLVVENNSGFEQWENHRSLVNVIHFALIYKYDQGLRWLDYVDVPVVVDNLISSIYSRNDLISHRSIQILCRFDREIGSKQMLDLTMALKFKLNLHLKNRIFYAIRNLVAKMFGCIEYKRIFMKVFDQDCYRCNNPYLKSIYLYFEYKYNLGPTVDIVKELDSEFLLTNNLQFYNTLYEHVELFIKFINDKSKFAKFFDFYQKMKAKASLNSNNNIDFEEFLKPIKRFLPAFAVVDGFQDLDSKENFIDSINKNEKISTESANSIEVFRNLLYNTSFKLTSVFIDLFNSQTYFYKNLIYQLLSNLREFDITTFEFLIQNETFNQVGFIKIRRYLDQLASGDIDDSNAAQEYVEMLLDKMDHEIARKSLLRERRYINSNPVIHDKINNRIVFLLNSAGNKRLCYYLLEYLMYNNIKYKNNKVVLDCYISSMYTIPNSLNLIQFYYANLSREEREYVHNNNPYYENRERRILEIDEESSLTQLTDEGDPAPIDVSSVRTVRYRPTNGVLITGHEYLGMFNTVCETDSAVDLYDPDLSKKISKITYKFTQDSRNETSRFRNIEIEPEPADPVRERLVETDSHDEKEASFSLAQINYLLLNNSTKNAQQLGRFLSMAAGKLDECDTNMLLAVFKVLLGHHDIKIDSFELLLEKHPDQIVRLVATTPIQNESVRNQMYKMLYYMKEEDALELVSQTASKGGSGLATALYSHLFVLHPHLAEKCAREFVKVVAWGETALVEQLVESRDKFDFDFSSMEQRDVEVFLAYVLAKKKIRLGVAIRKHAERSGIEKTGAIWFYYDILRKIEKFYGIRLIFELVLFKDDLYNYYLLVDDKKMFYGLVKHTANLREVKCIASNYVRRETNQAYLLLREVIGKITSRLCSYMKRDFSTLKIMSYDILRRLYKNDLREDEYISTMVEKCALGNVFNMHGDCIHGGATKYEIEKHGILCKYTNTVPLYTFRMACENNFITNYVNYASGISLDEPLLGMIAELPKSTLFQRITLMIGFMGEMAEAKKIKDEFINGRFKMWMNRYPIKEFILYNKWRTFIFNSHSNNKVNSLICKIKCLYAQRLMDSGLYRQAQIILNEINKLSSIELNQNLHKTMLDIKCCEMLGEKETAVEIINSMNVSRYTNEDKSRLYFLKYRNSGDEYFYNLSKSLYCSEDHKKKELDEIERIVTGREDVSDEYKKEYRKRLLDLINSTTIKKSRPYIVKLLNETKNDPNPVGQLYGAVTNKEKLHWFREDKNECIDDLINDKIMYNSKSMPNEYERLRSDYGTIAEIHTYRRISETEFRVIQTNGMRRVIRIVKTEEEKKKDEMVRQLRDEDGTLKVTAEEREQLTRRIVELNREITEMNTRGILKVMEIIGEEISPKRPLNLPINSILIGERQFGPLENMYKVNDINEWYVTKMTVIDEYTKMVACFLYCNCRADVVEFDGFGYPFLVSLVNKKTLPLLSKKIQDVFGMEGINGPFIAELCKYRSKLEESDVGLYADYFNVKGGLYDKEIEKILNAE